MVASIAAEYLSEEKCTILSDSAFICLNSTAGDLPEGVDEDIKRIIFTRSFVPVLEKKHLVNFPSLTDLYLKEAHLEKIEDDAFFDSKHLYWVDVSVNNLTTISPDIFASSPDVRYFNVSRNPYLVIPKNSPFLNAPHLKWIVMDGSGIKQLYSETFKGVPEVTTLSLSNNELTTIPGDLFKPMERLRTLDLSGNQFKSIRIDFSAVPNRLRLSMGNNPWECDCSLLPTIEWAKTQRIKDEIQCVTPENKKWTEITGMNCTKAPET